MTQGIEIEVVSRDNLSFVIERDYLACSACTIDEALSAVADNYSYEQEALISIMCDGVVVPKKYWKDTTLERTRKLKIILEAGSGFEIAAVISLVLAVASAVYSLYMMNKIKTNSNTQAKGNSIYDVNAQGNKVNLQQVVPENFGYMKRFPDYIADIHSYYQDNRRVQDILLCQGVGSYLYDNRHTDIYIGNTPISSLGSVQCEVHDPNDIIYGTKADCWFNSTEVTSSGHKIGGLQHGTGSKKICLQNRSFTVGERMEDMGWKVGDYVKISGTASIVQLTPNSIQYPEIQWYYDQYPPKGGNYWIDWNGARVARDSATGMLTKLYVGCNFFYAVQKLTSEFINPELTSDSKTRLTQIFITPFRDLWDSYLLKSTGKGYVTPALSIHLTKVYTYQDKWGNWSQKSSRVETFNSISGLPNGPSLNGNYYVRFALPADVNDIADPTYPVDVLPGTKAHLSYGVQVSCISSNSFWNMAVNHGIHDDDGLYKITTIMVCDAKTDDGIAYKGYVYGVERVDDNYNKYEDWQGFWCAGYFTDQFKIELTDKTIAERGVAIGPFRAAPIGALCSDVELDFNAPGGLCRVEDNGDYAPFSVQLQVMYQRVGDSEWKSFAPITMTGRNQNELGLTVKYSMPAYADWQFMVKRLTQLHSDDTKYIETVKWNGLKSKLPNSPHQYKDMTTIFLRITGDEVLSEMNNNQISTLWTRKLPNLTDGTLEATSEIAPVLKYIMSTSKYPNIFDLDNLKEYNDYWSIRGLQFNGTFDEDNTLLDAVRSVMQVGFAEPVVNGDKLQASMQKKMSLDDYTTILSAETITDFQFLKTPRRADEPLEVCVKYTSPETYKYDNIYIVYVPRYNEFRESSLPSTNSIENLDAFGVTSKDQARALGHRRVRQLAYMRESYTVKTEMLGLTLNFNDFVGLQLPLDTNSGGKFAGRVVGYRSDTATNRLIFDLDRSTGGSSGVTNGVYTGFAYINPEGKAVHITYKVTVPGGSKYIYFSGITTLEELGMVWDERYGDTLDYPMIYVGQDIAFIRPCWVRSIESDGSTCTIKLVQYHDEVYAKDPQFTLGYGLSSYGDSPYGKSY